MHTRTHSDSPVGGYPQSRDVTRTRTRTHSLWLIVVVMISHLALLWGHSSSIRLLRRRAPAARCVSCARTYRLVALHIRPSERHHSSTSILKINTARFEKTGRRPEAPQQATHRDNKGARGFGQSRRLWEVFERGRKGRKDLELLIWELALRFEPHHRAESCKLVIPLARLETFQ